MIKKCNHDPNKRDTTLIILEDEKMVYPKRYHAVCKYCNKSFCFIQKNNRYVKN